MFGVLVIGFGGNGVARALRITAQLHVFFGHGLRGAADFYVWPVRVKNLVARAATTAATAATAAIVIVVAVVAVAVTIALALPHEIIVHDFSLSLNAPRCGPAICGCLG